MRGQAGQQEMIMEMRIFSFDITTVKVQIEGVTSKDGVVVAGFDIKCCVEAKKKKLHIKYFDNEEITFFPAGHFAEINEVGECDGSCKDGKECEVPPDIEDMFRGNDWIGKHL